MTGTRGKLRRAAAALFLLAACGTAPEQKLHAEMAADAGSDPEPIPTDDIDRFFWYLATLESVPVVTFTSLTDAGWPSEVDFVVAFERDAFVEDSTPATGKVLVVED